MCVYTCVASHLLHCFRFGLAQRLSKGSCTNISSECTDVDINTSDTSTPTQNQISGPVTRAHACQINNQESSFLASYLSYLDNGNMCSVLLLRNDGQE
jgi:hypothetical protein